MCLTFQLIIVKWTRLSTCSAEVENLPFVINHIAVLATVTILTRFHFISSEKKMRKIEINERTSSETQFAMCLILWYARRRQHCSICVEDVDDDEWNEKETVLCNILSWLLYFLYFTMSKTSLSSLASSSASWRGTWGSRWWLCLLNLPSRSRDIFHLMSSDDNGDGFRAS